MITEILRNVKVFARPQQQQSQGYSNISGFSENSQAKNCTQTSSVRLGSLVTLPELVVPLGDGFGLSFCTKGTLLFVLKLPLLYRAPSISTLVSWCSSKVSIWSTSMANLGFPLQCPFRSVFFKGVDVYWGSDSAVKLTCRWFVLYFKSF